MPDTLSRRRLRHIQHAASAVSRDEWNRAYRDARRIAAQRDETEPVAVAVHNPRRIVAAQRY